MEIFDEKQLKLQISGMSVAIFLNEKEIIDGDSVKYGYDVERFTVKNESEILPEIKAHMKFIISEYDKSDNVNSFYVNGERAWFTPEERKGHLLTISSCETLGIKTISVPINGKMYDMDVQNAKIMLAQVQLYADASFLITAQHYIDEDEKETNWDAVNIDFTSGYPNMLRFNL